MDNLHYVFLIMLILLAIVTTYTTITYYGRENQLTVEQQNLELQQQGYLACQQDTIIQLNNEFQQNGQLELPIILSDGNVVGVSFISIQQCQQAILDLNA